MVFKRTGQADIDFFIALLGSKYVLTTTEQKEKYASDETEVLHYLHEIVLQAGSVDELSEIMRYCNRELIAVTPRGAGTGLSGGALPVTGGIVLDMKRFD